MTAEARRPSVAGAAVQDLGEMTRGLESGTPLELPRGGEPPELAVRTPDTGEVVTLPRDSQIARVLHAVQAYADRWGAGVTAYEIARELDLQQNVAARRLRDLERLGFVVDTGHRRPGSSSRQLICWRPAAAT